MIGDELSAQQAPAEQPGYALSASSDHEHERLRRQAQRYEPFTRRLLARAGVKPGMRVLDVGCGPGDVCFLISELVGAGGSVVGVERDEDALATARARAATSDITNVEFVPGDFRHVELDGGPFDALVGRLVLMYQPDPAAAVSAGANHVRPGGAVVFAEMSMQIGAGAPELISWPQTDTAQQVSRWAYGAFGSLGTQPNMGLRLPETFAHAGLLPGDELDTHVAIATGEEAVEAYVDLIRSLLPAIIAGGVASEQEVEIDTLADRLRADSGPAGRIGCWPMVVGAYATKPL
jgi:ubiquinone/menaquinone biosynthesis C-methylase UbiE